MKDLSNATEQEQLAELERCLRDPKYFGDNYCVVKDDTMFWTLPEWMKKLAASCYKEGVRSDVSAQRIINRLMSQVEWLKSINNK